MAEPEAQPTDDFLADDAAEVESLKQEIAKPEKVQAEVPAKPELKIEAADDGEEDAIEVENKGKFVRHGAMHQERERRKAAEARANAAEARYAADMARASERLAVIAQSQQQPRPEPKPVVQIPDINVDPIGHFQAQLAEQKRELDEARDFRKQVQGQQSQHSNMEAIATEVRRLETAFKATTPDYDDAQTFLQERWAAEAQAVGVSAEEAVRARTIETVQIAARNGRNPAEVAYLRAKALGFTGKAPEQQQGPDLDTIARGQAGSKSPTTAPGKVPAGTSIESILAMDDDDFAEKFGTKNYAKLRDKALGLI